MSFNKTLSIVVFSAVVLMGFALAPPRFVARGAFVVDWTMPRASGDQAAEKVRNAWRQFIILDITRLPRSEERLADLANSLNSAQKNRKTIFSTLSSALRVRASRENGDCDRFTVQVKDSDPKWAELVVHQVLEDEVSRMKLKARVGSGLAALRSKANAEDADQKETDLEKQLAESKANSRPTANELANTETQHFNSGLDLLVNLVGVFWNDSVRVVEKAHVEKRGAAYGWLVFIAAIFLGLIAGVVVPLLPVLRPSALSKPDENRIAKTSAVVPLREPPVIGQNEGVTPPPIIVQKLLR